MAESDYDSKRSKWGFCDFYKTFKHNHMLCECPPCTLPSPFVESEPRNSRYYLCVMSQKYVILTQIDQTGLDRAH